jgi:hypothetical protein
MIQLGRFGNLVVGVVGFSATILLEFPLRQAAYGLSLFLPVFSHGSSFFRSLVSVLFLGQNPPRPRVVGVATMVDLGGP